MLATQPDAVSILLGRLESLAPMVRAAAPVFDRERRMPDSLVHALADAGLFKLWLPRSMGGHELSPRDFMRVVEAAAELDASVGWLIGNLGGLARAAGYLSADVGRHFFSAPRAAVICSTANMGTATPVEGGYKVTGRWSFGSGILHATAVSVLCNTAKEGKPPQPVLVYLDIGKVCVHDGWHTLGLRGTASREFEIQSSFVPEAHCHAFVDQPTTEPSLLYRVPNISMFNWTVATVPLGIAEGVKRKFIAAAATKVRAGHPSALAEREVVHDLLGRLEAQRRAARAFMLEAMADLMLAVEVGGDALMQARAVYRTAMSHAAETAVSIVDQLLALNGAASIFEASDLERAWRDVHTAAQHIAMSPTLFANAGRVMLGLTPLTPRF